MFDINKPHQRRDGGEFKIVTIKNGYAFGFYGMTPCIWVVMENELKAYDTKFRELDIIQLPEEKEVIGYQRVFLDFIGDSYTNINDIKSDRILSKGIIKTTAKIIDGKLVSVKSEIVE